MRVGTWNIKGGRGASGHPVLYNRKKYLDQIAELICSAGLQAVALQEVDLRTLRSGFVHQPRYLAKKLSQLTGKSWNYLFAKAIRLQGGLYGNAILAAFPLEMVMKVPLKVPGQRCEERVFLLARILLPETSTEIGFGSFHLSVEGDYLRLQEAKKIKAALLEVSPLIPLILGGDLNKGQSSAAYQEMLTGEIPLGDLGPAAGSSFVSNSGYSTRIDFLFGRGVTPLASGVIDVGAASDHHLVWVECRI